MDKAADYIFDTIHTSSTIKDQGMSATLSIDRKTHKVLVLILQSSFKLENKYDKESDYAVQQAAKKMCELTADEIIKSPTPQEFYTKHAFIYPMKDENLDGYNYIVYESVFDSKVYDYSDIYYIKIHN